MDNTIISLAPGIILDVVGTTTAPTMYPTPILPGLIYSVQANGEVLIPSTQPMPDARGSLRVAFMHATPSAGNFYVVLAGRSASTGGGISVLCASDGTVLVQCTSDGSTVLWSCVTSGAIPANKLVMVTASWDSQNSLDGTHYAAAQLTGYPVTMPLSSGGTSPYAAPTWDILDVGQTSLTTASTLLPLPGTVGRVQFSSQNVL